MVAAWTQSPAIPFDESFTICFLITAVPPNNGLLTTGNAIVPVVANRLEDLYVLWFSSES